MNDLPWLSLLMVVPLVGALLVAVLPSRSALLARPIALGVALLTLVIGIAATAWGTAEEGAMRLYLSRGREDGDGGDEECREVAAVAGDREDVEDLVEPEPFR